MISDRPDYSWKYNPSNQRFTRIKNGITTHYKVERVLGSGFFSRVYAIAPENGGKEKAVKFFSENEKTVLYGGVKNAFLTEKRNLSFFKVSTS